MFLSSSLVDCFIRDDIVFFGIINLIFIGMGIRRMIIFYNTGYNNRRMTPWNNSFSVKFFTGLMVSFNYAALPISIYFSNRPNNTFYHQKSLFLLFIHCLFWLFYSLELYFEFRRKLSQEWTTLRGIWFLTTLKQIYSIIFFYSYNPDNRIKSNPQMKTMYFIQACFSMILFYFSIFKSNDYATNETEKLNENFQNINLNQNSRNSNNASPINGFIGIQNKDGNFSTSKNFPVKLEIFYVQPKNFNQMNIKSNKMRLIFTFLDESVKLYNSSSSEINETISVKKSVEEINEFNIKIYNQLSEKNIFSPFLLIFKAITDNFLNKQEKKFFKKKRRDKYLENIYIIMFNNFHMFMESFLTFLEIKDLEFIKFTINKFKTAGIKLSKDNSFVSLASHNTCLKLLDEIDKNISENKYKEKIQEFQKSVEFINNLMTYQRFFKIKIIDIKKSKKEITFSFEMASTVELYESTKIKGSFNSTDIINFCNYHLFQNHSDIRYLKEIIEIYLDSNTDIKDSEIKNNLIFITEKILGDLMLINNTLLSHFDIGSFMKSKKLEISDELLCYYFYLDQKLYDLNNIKLNTVSITNYEISCELEKIDSIEMMNGESLLVLCLKMYAVDKIKGDRKTWKFDFSFKDQKILFENLLIASKQKYNILQNKIEKILELIDSIMKILTNVLNESSENSENKDYDNLSDKGKMNNIEVDSEQGNSVLDKYTKDLIKLFNKLFRRKNRIILYSTDFRDFFQIYRLSDGNADISNEIKSKRISSFKIPKLLIFENQPGEFYSK